MKMLEKHSFYISSEADSGVKYVRPTQLYILVFVILEFRFTLIYYSNTLVKESSINFHCEKYHYQLISMNQIKQNKANNLKDSNKHNFHLKIEEPKKKIQ